MADGSFILQRSRLDHKPLIEPKEAVLFGSALLLDVRPLDAFRAGHLAHAVRVPIERWESAAKAPQSSFDNTAFWEAEIGALGIDGSRTALVYDDGRLTEAARAWFIREHFGAPARVINGGWPHLSSLPGQSGDAAAPGIAPFKAPAGQGQARLAARDDVRGAIEGPPRILDVRSSAEFHGEDLRRNARGGHLPGAAHLAHTQLIGPDGRLHSASTLRDIFLEAGLHPGDPLITHCDGGGRAALAALALIQAGYGDVRNYYLSFADWANDETSPIIGKAQTG